jgi:ADP-ribosylglycohydrolase
MTTPRPALLPTIAQLRSWLTFELNDRHDRGQETFGLVDELAAVPDSLDALATFASRLEDLPMRDGWPYEEPDDLDAILAASPSGRPGATPASVIADAATRVETAFLARTAGCILGKPVEMDPTAEEMRAALEPLGAWPLTGYVPEAALDTLGRRQPQWTETVEGRIHHAAEDDDLAYSAIGIVVLERYGPDFTRVQLMRTWLRNLPILNTFGPERTSLLKGAFATLPGGDLASDFSDAAIDRWADVLNPASEHCGALIRVDPWAWAALGDPVAAARMAWRDAGTTHRGFGLHASMLVAGMLAGAPAATGWRGIADAGLSVVPVKSRVARVVSDAAEIVDGAATWQAANAEIVRRWGEYTHCRIVQELGTLLVSLRFGIEAGSIGTGIGLQVSQGNDTDSFGATAGSLLGLHLGPDALDVGRWIAPFEDTIHLPLALSHDTSLSRWAGRAGALAGTVSG